MPNDSDDLSYFETYSEFGSEDIEALAQAKERHGEMLKDFEAVMATPAGRNVFKKIHQITGYNTNPMRYNQKTSDMNQQATFYNVARQSVWQALRAFLTPKQCAEIENPQPGE